MLKPEEALNKLNNLIGKRGRLAFFAAFISGIIAHLVILTSDIPNHDGLASMYFDQNMITSGRWFLGAACAPTSFYSLPWMIGILSMFYISVAAVFVTYIFRMKNPVLIVFSSIILAVFPSLASNFAYVFTMDGYMLGMLLCVVAVWTVDVNDKFGWLLGAAFLAFGMGCYQAYVAIAIVLSLYKVAEVLILDGTAKEKAVKILKYAGMGVFGAALYYVLLRLLLLFEGKELDTYQGINEMSNGNGLGLLGTVKTMYSDFISFSLGSRVLISNVLTGVALLLLAALSVWGLINIARKRYLYKKPLFYVFSLLILFILPCATNAIILISADVNYHVLMRYQWAFLIVAMAAIIDHGFNDDEIGKIGLWIASVSLLVVSLSYMVTDNIAYSNLQKKYEKTYAYCLRLADRIEQTEGYYTGIPIAMVGVVGNDSYPETDITKAVTSDLLGISGDYLVYKSENYEQFYRNYLGITFNMVSSDEVINFYNEDFYAEMTSFPAEGSVVLHDGIIYVKTENIR